MSHTVVHVGVTEESKEYVSLTTNLLSSSHHRPLTITPQAEDLYCSDLNQYDNAFFPVLMFFAQSKKNDSHFSLKVADAQTPPM